MDFTPMPGAAGEREAVARAMACEDLGYLTPFMQSNWLERADRAISALAPRRAAEILAAEARGYAMAVEDAANEATHLWEYGVPAQEFPRRIRAIEHGAGK